ncbi:MAG: amino acid--tRNA ligase-related protein [Kouleothrix sp.]
MAWPRWPAFAQCSMHAASSNPDAKIVGAATEGGANVFAIDYFGQPAYLSQSPQLYKQIMVGVFERVYEVGPAFRAEPHDTPRHINEFVSLDVELSFIRDHYDVMELLNRVLEGMVAAIHTAVGSLRELPLVLPLVPRVIPAIHFADALDMISRATGEDVRGEHDLAPAHERWLGAWAWREHASDFCSCGATPRPSARSTHPDPRGRAIRAASTCCFAGSSWCRVGSACTVTTTTWRCWLRAACAPSRSWATSRRSSTACRRTAASRSASSAGLHD